jgi:hypothetical protein
MGMGIRLIGLSTPCPCFVERRKWGFGRYFGTISDCVEC